MTARIGKLSDELARVIAGLGDRKLVLVEGDDDRDVLYRWFLERAADVVFYTASGSVNVVKLANRIAALRPDVQVFGIRDRDFLSDAQVSAAFSTPNSLIFIWRRYCIENYLLEPEALLPELEAFLGADCPINDVTAMEARMLEICRDLHSMMAANWLLIENGLSRYSDGHHLLPRADFIAEISNRIGMSLAEADVALADKEATLSPSLATLETAHHVTSGKHLLHQVYDLVAAVRRGLRKDHLFRLLRNRVKESVGIHADVREIVEQRILGDV